MQRDAMRPRARGLRATLLLVAIPGAAVASVDALPVLSGVRVIDARGTWVLPGFIDAHVHLPVGPNRARILNQLLAFGITAMRVPVGPVVSLRDSVERGDVVAPTVRTAGDMIDADDAVFGNPVRVHDEAGVRREGRTLSGAPSAAINPSSITLTTRA